MAGSMRLLIVFIHIHHNAQKLHISDGMDRKIGIVEIGYKEGQFGDIACPFGSGYIAGAASEAIHRALVRVFFGGHRSTGLQIAFVVFHTGEGARQQLHFAKPVYQFRVHFFLAYNCNSHNFFSFHLFIDRVHKAHKFLYALFVPVQFQKLFAPDTLPFQ